MLTEIRDTEGRRWRLQRGLSHDSERVVLVRQRSGGGSRRGTCRLRFVLGSRAEIVSQGSGRVEEEERDDGSIRTTRVPPRGEIVAIVEGPQVDELRQHREEMIRNGDPDPTP